MPLFDSRMLTGSEVVLKEHFVRGCAMRYCPEAANGDMRVSGGAEMRSAPSQGKAWERMWDNFHRKSNLKAVARVRL